MKNETDSRKSPQQPSPALAARSAPPRSSRRETLEEAIARTQNMPTLLDELTPETIAWIQREAAKHDEVMGYLPPLKQKKGR